MLRRALGRGQVGFVVIRCDQLCWGIAERDVIGQPLRRHVTARRGDRQIADGVAQLNGQSTNPRIRWEQPRSGKSEGIVSPCHALRRAAARAAAASLMMLAQSPPVKADAGVSQLPPTQGTFRSRR